MAGVRGDIALQINLIQTGTIGLGTPKLPVAVSEELSLVSGTDATNKANILYAATRTLAASGTENLDLAGVLADAFGATITAAEIVLLYVKAHSDNTNNAIVGGAGSNPFLGPLGATGTFTIKPGEYFSAVSQSGWAVTAATGDLLKVLNSAGTTGITYDVLVVGRTVAA